MLAPKLSHSSRQIYRPSPEPRLRVEKKGSNRCRSTSGGIGGPSLQTDISALPASRAASRSRIAPGSALAWRWALSSRLTSTRRRCSGSNITASGAAGRSRRSRPSAPSGSFTVRAQSAAAARTSAVASMARAVGIAPGATSITSSTRRFSRATLSATIDASRACAGGSASSSSSALACEIAASGLRISCAMPAETRPIAASFSCRMRACSVRRSSSRTTANGSPARSSADASACACAARLRMKRTRTRSVRVCPPSKASGVSRPASGQLPSASARSTACCSATQAARSSSVNGARGPSPCSASNARAAGFAARTRSRRSTTSTPSAISSITRRFSCACWRASSRLPRAATSSRTSRPASSPASSVMMNRPSPAMPDCSSSSGASPLSSSARDAASSSISATAAATPSASRRELITPAISTGSTSSAVRFRFDPMASRCSTVKAARSTPIVASQRRRRCQTSRGGWAIAPKRGSSHNVIACTA